MRLKIRYWGKLTDLAGCEEEELILGQCYNISALNDLLTFRYPAFIAIPLMFFYQNKRKTDNQIVFDGMEIDCMPPFSGG